MTRSWFAWAAAASLSAAAVHAGCAAQEDEMREGIVAVEGLKVGHVTLDERPTGCTVILVEGGAVGGVDVRGGAPGTRELALLDPVNTVDVVHAVVLSGGSAYGLDAATGVMRYLEERGIGYPVGPGVVPIVVGAILFDLGVGGRPDVRPGADCGYGAAAAASDGPVEEGSVGAGAGATVGKLGGSGRAMKGGVGTASIALEDGLVVAAIVAVNAIGDIVDPATGEIVAGVRDGSGSGFADARRMIRAGASTRSGAGENTTIGLVATNATLTKAQITKVAQMAQDGLARTIYPAHTPGDGDTVFGLATGAVPPDPDAPGVVGRVGALAADVMAEAILRAVRAASGLPDVPSVRDLEEAR